MPEQKPTISGPALSMPNSHQMALDPSSTSSSPTPSNGMDIASRASPTLTILEMRQKAVNVRQRLIEAELKLKQQEMKELTFLEAEGNILDFEPDLSSKAAPVTHSQPAPFTPPAKGSTAPAPEAAAKKSTGSANSLAVTATAKQEKSSLVADAPSSRETKCTIALKSERIEPCNSGPANELKHASDGPKRPRSTPGDISEVKPSRQKKNEPLKTKAQSEAEAKIVKLTREVNGLKRLRDLKKQGLLFTMRISKQIEPPRKKTHWDYLLAEVAWLARDFHEVTCSFFMVVFTRT